MTAGKRGQEQAESSSPASAVLGGLGDNSLPSRPSTPRLTGLRVNGPPRHARHLHCNEATLTAVCPEISHLQVEVPLPTARCWTPSKVCLFSSD